MVDPVRTDCQVTAEYAGLDVDAALLAQAQAWYYRLIHEAPLEYLAPEDITMMVTSEIPKPGALSVNYYLSQQPVRLVSMRWRGSAEALVADMRRPDVDAQTVGRAIARLNNPYCDEATHRPVAMLNSDGRTVTVFGDPGTELVSVMAVMPPGADRYPLAESALTLMPALP